MSRKPKYSLKQRYSSQKSPKNDPIEKWANFLNLIGLFLALWAIIYPEPYPIVITIMIIQPLACLGLLHCFSGKIHLESSRMSNQPQLLSAFLAPFIALALRGLMDCHILSWTPFWIPFILSSLILFGLTIRFAIGLRSPVLFLVFCLIYGYGATITLNKILDSTNPEIYQTQVLNKKISHSPKGFNTYYFTVSPSGPIKTKKDIFVPMEVYAQRRIGDNAIIKVYQGGFHIPWFKVE